MMAKETAMKFKIGRYGIQIIPENDEDIAYIEDTLGLKKENDCLDLLRKNAFGLECIAYLEAKRSPYIGE